VSQRERKLLMVIVGFVVLWGGWMLFSKYNSSMGMRRSQLQSAQTKLDEANRTLQKGRLAVAKMAELQKRSLPADREKAQTLYKAWLLAKAKSAGLTVNDIKLAQPTAPSKAFDIIGYKIQATGTLSSVVGMLYEFYHSPQLHQITRLNVSRPVGASQMIVSLDVEALCLQNAVATDTLPEGDSKRLALASAAEYQKRFGERDLASVYTPPRPPTPHIERTVAPPPPPPPKFDEAELAFFTGTTESSKGAEAWISVRSKGVTLHLTAGDPIKVGALDGTIESVEARTLVLKAGDKKYQVTLGQSLRSGKELDADGNVKPETDDDRPKS
jgi:hypothetical protein